MHMTESQDFKYLKSVDETAIYIYNKKILIYAKPFWSD